MRIPKERVTFKVNLEDLFGERLDISTSTKEAIGQAIIDRIVDRTQSGVDKNGRSLGKYSKSYADSLSGQVFGKKKGGQVNLTATSDMLTALTIIETTPQTITIGYNDQGEKEKAFGHISGMEGHPVLDGKVQKRDFMGLPNKELQSISDEFIDEVKTLDRIQRAESREDLDREVLAYLSELEAQIIPSEEI